MQRRSLLRLGAGAAALLALAGCGVALFQPGLEAGRLTSGSKRVFEAVARAVLDGSLPTSAAESRAAIDAQLRRIDAVVRAFPPAVQGELSQLLAILSTAPGRRMLAGLSIDWTDATVAQLLTAFDEMRLSSVSLRQQAYHALRDITNAAFYADATAWPLIGYPGPRAI